MDNSNKTGKLYVVSVPLGNYLDFTYRAVETLQTVDAILCEDSRRAGLLLKHFGIKKN